MPRPDPVLTASIYSNRGLDELVHGVVHPFRARLVEVDPEGGWSLWWVRYSRNGEHLKLRVHGPEERRELARRLLQEAVDAHFAALPAAEDAPRVSRPGAPAIDPDDEEPGDRPDRTLQWTGYRRSHVNLGPPVFLNDDEYVARFTACLAAGAGLVLETLRPDAEGGIAGPARQRALIRGVMGGIGALGLTAGERAAYLAYHRDWLVRFAVADEEKESALRALFDRRVEAMAPAVEQLRRGMAAEWEGAPAMAAGAEGAWRAALGELRDYLARFRGIPEYLTDPFTGDAIFPPVFKVLHALANHLGVSMFDEAFVHHLLGASAAQPSEAAGELTGV